MSGHLNHSDHHVLKSAAADRLTRAISHLAMAESLLKADGSIDQTFYNDGNHNYSIGEIALMLHKMTDGIIDELLKHAAVMKAG